MTFLLSPWTCIFDAGCQGVLTAPTPERVQGCCSYGAHFTGEGDVADTLAAAQRLTDEQWQWKRRANLAKKGEAGVIKRNAASEIASRLTDDACIFLNRPGFDGGPGCALHRGALDAGERPLDWKPDVCWQLPLRREDDGPDVTGHVTSTIRQWDRRHWGTGGMEFHWWCTESADAFAGAAPVYLTLSDELVELCGEAVYDLIRVALDARRGADVGVWTPLPHPALRERPTMR